MRCGIATRCGTKRAGGRRGTEPKQAAYDDEEEERMLLLDDRGGDGGEAAACRCGAGIRSEKRARSGREAGEKRARSGRVRNGGEGGGVHTAYEEEDEPLPDDVSEAGGHEGAGNSRFVTSPSARRRFATPRWATSASRASCIQKLGGTRLPSVHCFSSRCYYC
jgi:hypothetical protein